MPRRIRLSIVALTVVLVGATTAPAQAAPRVEDGPDGAGRFFCEVLRLDCDRRGG